MTNRENVIKRLEECLSASCRGFRTCPYSDNDGWDAVEAALALLKEQEAMEQCLKTKCVVCPHCAKCDVDENGLLKEQEPVKWIRIHPAQIYECSGCGQNVMTGDIKAYKYCHGCGRRIAWPD